jgi:hypothetical protein
MLLPGRGVRAKPGCSRTGSWMLTKRCTETHVFFAKPFVLGLRCFHSCFKFVLVTHRAASPRQFPEHVLLS